MSESLLVAIVPAVITGAITLLGVILTNGKHDAVIDTKLEELTREVRKHNNFAERVPVIEKQLQNIEEKVNFFHKI
jgi:hypothetical protein